MAMRSKYKRSSFSFNDVKRCLQNFSLGGPYAFENIEICEIGSTTAHGSYKSITSLQF